MTEVEQSAFEKISVDFDHTNAEFCENIYSSLVELRETTPVMYGSRFGGFMALTRYEDVKVAASDHERFSPAGGVTIPHVANPVASLPLECDPPEHGDYRRIMQPFFTVRRVNDMQDLIRPIVVDHIEAFRDSGRADLVKQLAGPIPAIVIAMLLGMAPTQWSRLKTITTTLQVAAVQGDIESARQAADELRDILMFELDRRRAAPGDDIISAIVHARIDGEQIPPEIAFSMVQIVVVAGFDTTVYGIGTLLKNLAADRALQDQVRAADRQGRNAVIEESLRIDSPVFGLARSAVKDTELSGCPIPAGSRLLVAFGAANHDPRVFDAPEKFDSERANLTQHLAFGYGRHRCIGEHLAKLQIRIVLDELLDRIPTFALDTSEPVEMRYSMTRGPLSLPVTW